MKGKWFDKAYKHDIKIRKFFGYSLVSVLIFINIVFFHQIFIIGKEFDMLLYLVIVLASGYGIWRLYDENINIGR